MRNGYGARRIVVWQGDDGLEGYGFYRTRLGESASVRIDELHATTTDAVRGLAEFFANIDLIDEVVFRQRPTDEPIRWMLEDSRAFKPTSSEFQWYRLLDLPGALESRTYTGAGSLVIEVEDSLCADNDGRWQLTVDEGTASCRRVDTTPDVVLDVGELGALYMGGRSALSMARARRIEGADGAGQLLDAFFRTQEPPWSGEDF